MNSQEQKTPRTRRQKLEDAVESTRKLRALTKEKLELLDQLERAFKRELLEELKKENGT